jgi:hypothetical protein
MTSKSSGQKSYADVPWAAVMTLANHEKEVGSFHLARDQVKPPISLQQLVFPWLEEAQEELQRMKAGSMGLHTKQKKKQNKYITPQRVLEVINLFITQLFTELRITILQDAPLLFEHAPNHPIFLHPVFQHPDYCSWAEILLASCNPVEEEDKIKKAQINNVILYLK